RVTAATVTAATQKRRRDTRVFLSRGEFDRGRGSALVVRSTRGTSGCNQPRRRPLPPLGTPPLVWGENTLSARNGCRWCDSSLPEAGVCSFVVSEGTFQTAAMPH